MKPISKKGQLSLLQTGAIAFLTVGLIVGISATVQSKLATKVGEMTSSQLGGTGWDDPNFNSSNMAVDAVNNSLIAGKDLTSFNSILALVLVGVVVLGLIFLFQRRQV